MCHTGLQQWLKLWSWHSSDLRNICTVSLRHKASLKSFQRFHKAACAVSSGESQQKLVRARQWCGRFHQVLLPAVFQKPAIASHEKHILPPSGKICAQVKGAYVVCKQYTHFIAHSGWIKMRRLYDFWIWSIARLDWWIISLPLSAAELFLQCRALFP